MTCIIAQRCAEAGLNRGCCSLASSPSCYVPGGNCYCDNVCTRYNDCCDDVLAAPLCGELK